LIFDLRHYFNQELLHKSYKPITKWLQKNRYYFVTVFTYDFKKINRRFLDGEGSSWPIWYVYIYLCC